MIKRTEGDALQRDAGVFHEDEGDGEHQRNGDRDHQTGSYAKADEADGARTMTIASNRAVVKPETASSTTAGWSETTLDIDADREVGDAPGSSCASSCSPNVEQVGTGFHADGEADRGLALEPEQRRSAGRHNRA